MLHRKVAVTAALLLMVCLASAQAHREALLSLMQKARIPGLSLAYVKDGKIAEQYALGLASNETKEKVNDSTIFAAASLSKSIFAYAVFGLIQEKKIDLDKPVDTYFQYPDVAHDPRSKLVTVRMLLSHSSGLPNWRNSDTLKFKFNPGEKYNYSGEGLVWLSKAVESITGKEIGFYLQEKIIRPLKMTRTSYVWDSTFGSNFAYPHIETGRTETRSFPSQANVAHSLQTTAGDYAKFLIRVLQDKKFMAALHKEPTSKVGDKLGWGLGLGRQTTADGISFWQWGDNGTFKGFVMGYPDKKAAVVYFANGMEGLSIAKEVMGMFISKDQPSLDYLGYDSVESVDIDIFSRALKSPVADALKPYYVAGSNVVDTNKVAVGIINYLGNRFMELHEYDKSIDFFSAGIRANPTLGKLYGGLGESFLRIGRRAEAIVAFEKAASIDTAVKAYGKLISKLRHIAPTAQEGRKLITFKLPEYMYARSVSLAGSFNDWNDVTEPMTWENGAWTITIPLRKGSYKYKFVVDGVWLTDVRNPKFSKDSFDSELTVD